MSDEPYRDADRPAAERTEDLLGRMTLEEKLAQLGCVLVTALIEGTQFRVERAREAIPHGIGQLTRLGGSTSLRPVETARVMNEIQHYARAETRLGIPVMVHEECLAGYSARDATVFPQALGLAASWDPDLLQEVASAIRDEMLAVGARLGLGPVLDVARDPRWGRVEETYGEDPVLAGSLGAAYVKGLQTDDLRRGVLATGKHFLGHAMPEGGRNHGPVQCGPRELREVYAEPFAAAIREAGLGAMMNSYSSVDGLAPAGSTAILTDLLRGELGFQGVVVADYSAVSYLVTHHRVASDKADAARLALVAGLDMELPEVDCFGEPLVRALGEGSVPPEVVDRAVRRVLFAKFRLGLFDAPFVEPDETANAFRTASHIELARRAATSAVVLLKNDEGLLPIDPGVQTIAVIGPGADDQRLLQGDYHFPVHQEIHYLDPSAVDTSAMPGGNMDTGMGPYFVPHVTPVEGIRAAVSSESLVLYEPGCAVSGGDRSRLAAAVRAAGFADVAVVVLAGSSGLHPRSTVGEGRDATDLKLTGVQEELAQAVAATGTPTVVVVMSGRVHTLATVADHAGALLYAPPLGEQGGHALADVLFGKVEPSGRLPVTIPRVVGQLPVHGEYRSGGGRSMFYGDYTDCSTTPLYPFGFGLGYTQFSYDDLALQAGSTSEPTVVSVAITNSGGRAGVEVVQLYASDLVASTARPEHQLVGFARVALGPGARRRVRFEVHPSRLAFFNPEMQFVVEPGEIAFSLGRSITDAQVSATVTFAGPVVEFRQRDVVATRAEVSDDQMHPRQAERT